MPQTIVDLYDACTDPNPATRPSARDAYLAVTRAIQEASNGAQR